MTAEQEQLESQSRAAIKAWCDDPSVQLEVCGKEDMRWSSVVDSKGIFNTLDCYYRIAKPRKWYRVGKLKHGLPFMIYGEGEEHWQSQPNFEKWLDERKYYD